MFAFMGLLMLRQEQTATAEPHASTPTLHCAMKVKRPRAHYAPAW
jgi:hypothetical protein